jgi:hypothetical protein
MPYLLTFVNSREMTIKRNGHRILIDSEISYSLNNTTFVNSPNMLAERHFDGGEKSVQITANTLHKPLRKLFGDYFHVAPRPFSLCHQQRRCDGSANCDMDRLSADV